jgi:3-phenylpropionate/cinnamic acid dioxygenase small subunit
MLIAPRPDLLATSSEQRLEARLDQLEIGLGDASSPDQENLRLRIQRLRGVLTWGLQTQYHQRLTDAHQHLRELNDDVVTMTARYDAYVRARQAAMHSYVGYQAPIVDLRVRVGSAHERLDVLMARQGHMLENVAIRELTVRRARLETYQNQARFAFADSYDRAVKAQAQAQ